MHLEQREASKNLPRFSTPLVGRTHELAALGTRLEGARIVTVVGTGGIGKTRLAVEAAAARGTADADVWFVDLAPVSDRALVADAIAAAMGLELAAGADLRASLVSALRPERGLLLLDNCEHVRSGVAAIASAIVRDCPNIRILATSREP
ncbi:MAG: AAA family ATPase, partial [Candidatus Eremiobacteraeota bacterium]|nr:AAA family ATPase [Candidatus Eremiobacteraeota bacterium]